MAVSSSTTAPATRSGWRCGSRSPPAPAGPFVDSGRQLTREPFAIDGHVFVDRDGGRWLFYATDFLERSHVGTGIVVDRLLDPLTLAGEPRPVVLPHYDWQVYDPVRREKGGVRWHTVEGPFVLERKGLCYLMFSGGNWQNPSYGVSYAKSRRLDEPSERDPAADGEWEQAADGDRVVPILRTLPGQVVGPGHNSVVRGPDNRQLFCVYHRWSEDRSGRVPSIDPLDWAGDRMLVLGPSVGPRPAPLSATWSDFFDAGPREGLGPAWEIVSGLWSSGAGEAVQASTANGAEALAPVLPCPFAAELSVRALDRSGAPGACGAALHDEGGALLRLLLAPAERRAKVALREGSAWREEGFPLPSEFDPAAWHLLRLEADGRRARIALDGLPVWRGRLEAPPARLALTTDGLAAAFSGFAATVGWEDLFLEEGEDLAELGWEGDGEGWEVGGRELRYRGPSAGLLVKGPLLGAYELVVNARVEDAAAPGAGWGLHPALDADGHGPLLAVERHGDGWAVVACRPAEGGEGRVFPLPPGFDAGVHQQFRVRKAGDRVTLSWEDLPLGELCLPASPTRIGLHATGTAVFDMVRLTAIASA